MLTDLLTFWSSLDSDGEGGTAGSEASDDALVMLTVLCSLICWNSGLPLIQMVRVERLAQKLTIMSFIGNYFDNIHHLKPVCSRAAPLFNGAVHACVFNEQCIDCIIVRSPAIIQLVSGGSSVKGSVWSVVSTSGV